jgi:glycopeptide antibiotics resistance protein
MTRSVMTSKFYLAPILVGFAVSFSFEFLQQFTYSRNPNVLDLIYNTGGSALGSIGIHILKKTGER